MPYNGSGSFSPPGANYPAVSGTTATAANRNAVDADFASGLSNAITKDGQTTPTANIPLGGNKITGLAAGAAATDAANVSNLQSGTGIYVATVGGTADVITLAPNPAIAAYAAGQRFSFIASGANTTNVTVNVSSLGAKAVTKNGATALAANDILSASIVVIEYDGTQFQVVGRIDSEIYVALASVLDEDDMASDSATLPPSQQSVKAYVDNVATAGGYIRGLILSNNGTDATNDIDISAGACSDGTYSESIVSAAITKQIDAPWAVGTAGGMDTGSVTDSTWYYVWIIKRSDTGVVDALFSLSPTSPTMPTNYDFKRLIGAVYRNSASAIDEFSAYETSGGGVRFRWKTLTTDLSSSLSTTARTDNLRNPDGMVTEVTWLIRVIGASTWAAYFSSPDDTDQAPSASTSTPVGQMFAATGAANHKEISVMTDSSGLVRARGSGSLSTYYVNCVSFEMARR